MNSEWFESAFEDWMGEQDIFDSVEQLTPEITKLLKATYYAGAHQGVEFARVCVEQELS